jgi:ligand-binding sensor domain-containing protein/DNA-binding CsgD family transcriptional regulator
MTRKSPWPPFRLPVTIAAGLLFLLALAGRLPAQVDDFSLEMVSTVHGLSSNSVFCMLQDRAGFLWFGTSDGLNRYDGREIKVFRHRTGDPRSLAHNTVMALCQDPKGKIWVGTWGGGLDRFDSQAETFEHFPARPGKVNAPSHDFIRDLHIAAADPDSLWIGTWGGGLNRLDLETGNFAVFRADPRRSDSLASDNIQTIFADSAGQVWVGTPKGLQRFVPETQAFASYPFSEERRDPAEDFLIRNIYESPGQPGLLWICTLGHGLFRFMPDSGKWRKIRDLAFGPENSVMGNIFCIQDFAARPGMMLLGTGFGLFLFEPETETYAPIPPISRQGEAGARDMVWTMLADRSGLVWTSLFGSGVAKLNPYLKRFRRHGFYGMQAGAVRSMQSLAEDPRGRIWVADRGGELIAHGGQTYLYDRRNDRLQPLWPHPLVESGSQGNISAIAVTASGDTWFAGRWVAIRVRPDGEKADVFNLKPPLTDPEFLLLGSVLCLAEDTAGRMWFGMANGVCRLDPATGEQRFFPLQRRKQVGIIGFYIQDILADGEGRVWIASEDGLFQFQPEREHFVCYRSEAGRPDSLSDNHVSDLCLDGRGRLWLATRQGIDLAVISREKVTFQRFAPRGFSSYPIDVHSLLVDDAGDVWAGTSNGIARLQPAVKSFSFYEVGETGSQAEFLDGVCLRARDGRFFFGGKNGFVSFDPRRWKFAVRAPNIVLTEMLVNDQALPQGYVTLRQHSGQDYFSVSLSHLQNNISMQFAALDFARPEKNQYAYRLGDAAQEWVHLGYDRRLHLAGMKPGTYRLQIKGATGDGLWNERGLSLEIVIRPPFWQSWWFRALCLALSLALILYQMRTRARRLARKIKTEADLQQFCLRFGLSNREKEIIRLILAGKSNREIEDRLFIAGNTVKNHIYSIFKKLGVKSRSQLIAFFKNLVIK